jgi:hypothetical protein
LGVLKQWIVGTVVFIAVDMACRGVVCGLADLATAALRG